MNGVVGFKIQGQGQSAANIVADCRLIGAHTHVVVDEPKAAGELLRAGVCQRVIYRRGGDDHAPSRFDARQFVLERHYETLEHCPDAYIYLGNEPGDADPERLAAWTLTGQQTLREVKRRGVIFNWQYFAPKRAQWLKHYDRNVRYSAEHGDLLGAHIYFHSRVRDTLDAFDIAVAPVEVFGADCPELAITEYGAAIGGDPHNGWQNDLSVADFAEEIEKGALIVRQAGGSLQLFYYGVWYDFDVRNAELLGQIKAINDGVKVKPRGGSVQWQPGIVSMRGPWVNLRAAPKVESADLGDVRDGDRVLYQPTLLTDGVGRLWYRVTQNGVAGYCAAWLMQIDAL